MERTDKVRIEGPGTELEFSIKGMPAVIGAGRNNIPDGECTASVVKGSVNGFIKFNVPSLYQGTLFYDIGLVFKNGKVIRANVGRDLRKSERLNNILNTDDGAGYMSEFSLGMNPIILHPFGDILFDEKIKGSFYITIGNSAINPNYKSNTHWGITMMQTKEYGGGSIYFDKELIVSDGKFIFAK